VVSGVAVCSGVGDGFVVTCGVSVGDGEADGEAVGDGLGEGVALTPKVRTPCSSDITVALEGMVVFCEETKYLELPLLASRALAADWS